MEINEKVNKLNVKFNVISVFCKNSEGYGTMDKENL